MQVWLSRRSVRLHRLAWLRRPRADAAGITAAKQAAQDVPKTAAAAAAGRAAAQEPAENIAQSAATATAEEAAKHIVKPAATGW